MHIQYFESKEGDWYGLYINGRLKSQGHSLSGWDAIKIIWDKGGVIGSLDSDVQVFSEDAMNEMNGRFPDSIDDLI